MRMDIIFICRPARRLPASMLAAALALGAGCIDNHIPDPTGRPRQCDSASYVAFDPANHAEQDVRLDAAAQMKGLMAAALASPAEAATNFAAAADVYATSAELQAKVQGRTDDHLAEKPNVGTEIDARISAALEAGGAATAAHDIEVQAEIVDKALTEFFFLSVFHEVTAGQAVTWDEAFGYFGAGADNDLGSLRGFAAVAKKRDDENGTALEAVVFQRLVDGSCQLAERLAADEVEIVDVFADEGLASVVDSMDDAMIDVLAYSVGHEAMAIAAAKAAGDGDGAAVKLVELDGFFRPLERLMQDVGGDSARRATAIRAPVDAALAADDDSWLATFDAEAILAAIEAERDIDVKE